MIAPGRSSNWHNWEGRSTCESDPAVEHDCLSEELQAHMPFWLVPMHVTNWAEVHRVKTTFVGHLPEMDVHEERMFLYKRDMHCLEDAWVSTQTQRKVEHCFTSGNSFTMKNGMLYVNTTPKGKTEGLLALCGSLCTHQCAALNGMHWDARITRVSKEC